MFGSPEARTKIPESEVQKKATGMAVSLNLYETVGFETSGASQGKSETHPVHRGPEESEERGRPSQLGRWRCERTYMPAFSKAAARQVGPCACPLES